MSVLCHNCRFDGNAKDAAFCSRCGSSLNAANANTSYAPPPTQQAYPAQAAPQYANVVQAQPQVLASGEFIVVPGQVLTATGHCAHAVQTNEFTCPGVLLGILFFPIGILCCLLLTERRCVHCGTILN
ncbi:hypothetical protein, variant [Aphanomyces invadans]|uniref:Uncharacterized protein n=1 Tax=Aphanomyces invadans TaxID=157072 RepID=A0A024UHF7_9STRA|nr:hypothetical protein, variant [Aphanomyces invadans]ETW05846.1 hypothetical protein, variant [Aphanomyces invadans]|eukprot:XP_008865623.1 hypothetical protein, variant [Aphanomyces invadans]